MSVSFDPLVAEWFTNRFPQPTEPQSLGWPQIRSGHDALISAPTGLGKTLAAFLLSIDDLVRAARAGELSDQVEMIYVSPLKALNNDVQKNLETPLAGIAALAAERGVSLEIHAVVNDKRGAHRNDARLSACRITWRSLGWTACYASL